MANVQLKRNFVLLCIGFALLAFSARQGCAQMGSDDHSIYNPAPEQDQGQQDQNNDNDRDNYGRRPDPPPERCDPRDPRCCPQPGGCDDSPENATVVLAGLALGMYGLMQWRRKIKERAQ